MSKPTEAEQTALLRWAFVVALITLAAAALRLLRLSVLAASPLETAMLLRINAGFGAIWSDRAVSQAPLADVAFWLAAQVPGPALTNARILSAAAGALALPIFWLAAARASGGATATLLVALLAFSPLVVATAYTAQPTPLALLALALVWLAFQQLRHHNNLMGWLMLAAASLTATLMTASLAIIIIPMLVTLVLFAEQQRHRVALGVGGIVVLCLLSFALIGGAKPAAPLGPNLFIATMLSTLVGPVGVLPGLLEQAVIVSLSIGVLAALIDWQRWEGILPYICQFAISIVILLIAAPLLGGSEALVLLLPAGFLFVASGVCSVGWARFGWPLAAALTAVLLAAAFIGVIELVV